MSPGPIHGLTANDDPGVLGTFESLIRELSDRLEALQAEVRDTRNYAHRLWIRSGGRVLILNVDEIDWVEADAKHSCLHTREATHRIRESISSLEARLDPARFARIHRSAIVNLDRVVEVDCSPGSRGVILVDGTRIPMSRSHKLRVLELAAEADGSDRGVADPTIR